MKNILLLFFLSFGLTASAQSWEFNSSPLVNFFYDFDDYYIGSYTLKSGYNLNVGIDDVYLNDLRLRFILGFSKYSGGIDAKFRSQGSGTSLNGHAKKNVLQFGLYPINFGGKEGLNVNIGTEFSALIGGEIEGTYTNWYIVSTSGPVVEESYDDVNDLYDSYHSMYYFGISIRVAYDIPLSEDFYLVPQYSLYVGLSNEFIEFPKTTKSLRNMLGIGIKRKM